MSAKPHVLPLTPAMRAALAESTTGMARRSLLFVFATLLFFLAVLWLVSLGEPADEPSAMRFGLVIVPGMGGFLLILIGVLVARQKGASARALRLGTYQHHEGSFRITELTLNRATRHTLRVGGIALELEYFVPTDLPRLLATTGGTVLFAPEAKHLFAAWDREGELLYAAPDYDLDHDREAPRPAGVAVPAASARPADLGGRLIALLNPLARSTAAMIALGVALLVLAVVVNNTWPAIS